jgi:hypothetical protein
MDLLTLPPSVFANIAPEINTGCWLWCDSGHLGGYGRMMVGGKRQLAHRLVYTLIRGPIPEGLELDHLCRQTACVNPDHLEPVTHQENMRRSPVKFVPTYCEKKAVCKRGHALEGLNVREARHRVTGQMIRTCRACARWYMQQRRLKQRGFLTAAT